MVYLDTPHAQLRLRINQLAMVTCALIVVPALARRRTAHHHSPAHQDTSSVMTRNVLRILIPVPPFQLAME